MYRLPDASRGPPGWQGLPGPGKPDPQGAGLSLGLGSVGTTRTQGHPLPVCWAWAAWAEGYRSEGRQGPYAGTGSLGTVQGYFGKG